MFGQSLLSGAFGTALVPDENFGINLYTGTGTNQTIGGKIKGAASFNGSNTGMVVPGNMGSLLGNEFSISFWFYAPTTFPSSGYPTFASLYGYPGYGSAYGWSIEYPNSGKIMFYWVSSSAVGNNIQSSTLTPGEWCHVICTKDSNSANIYINNVLDNGSTAVSSNAMWYNGFEHFTVGCKQNAGAGGATSSHLSDSMDQLRIFTSVLTSAERAAVYAEDSSTANTLNFPTGAGCVAAYQFDNNTNGPLNTDKISTCDFPSSAGCLALYQFTNNSNDTCGSYNGTDSNITYSNGVFNKAASFNGSSSKISLGNQTFFNAGDYSVSFWLNNQGNDSSYQIIMSQRTSSDAGSPINISMYGVSYGSNNGKLYFAVGGSYFVSNTVLSKNTWYHLVFTIVAGGNMNIYVDGVLDSNSTTESTTRPTPTTQNLAIGANGSNTDYPFNGLIDQVRFFNTALTQSQVTELARGADSAKNAQDLNNNIAFNGWTNFKPDLVWIKKRGPSTANHLLQNTVNGPGTGSAMYSAGSPNYAAGNYDIYGYLSSFDAQGFTTQGGTSGGYPYDLLGESGATYVSWNWKAGGTAVANNDGTITSQVSANTDYGFSIVNWVASSTASDTIGSGLGKKVEFLVTKENTTRSWNVWHKDLPNNGYLHLNTTNAEMTPNGDRATVTNNTTFTAEGTSGNSMLAYCWHSVPKYSKIGSYTGNGSSTGPTISTGFRPTWLMVKRTDSTSWWNIQDDKRDPVNPRIHVLGANDASAEISSSNYAIDFNDAGFQLLNSFGDWNASGGTYIYMTFA